jgi:tRNA dimethylallyltransferase
MDRARSERRCLAITGPTATGKTDIALRLAEEFPVEIVSMDSAMVYRGMDIGTAKPSAEIRASLPHHLIDILDPEQSFSAGRFAADAAHAIDLINAAGKIALVVGGTMLYLKALRDGIAALPERDLPTRAAIDRRAEQLGWPALHAELAQRDPKAAERIEPTDRQRIQRGLEVLALTGRALSELQAEGSPAGLDLAVVALVPADRAALAVRIADRFRAMVAGGFVEEVKRLRARPGLTAASTAMRSVGYRQVWSFLEGETDWEEAEQRAVIATRQLAKRQLTWLRGDTRSEQVRLDDPDLLDRLRQALSRCCDSA